MTQEHDETTQTHSKKCKRDVNGRDEFEAWLKETLGPKTHPSMKGLSGFEDMAFKAGIAAERARSRVLVEALEYYANSPSIVKVTAQKALAEYNDANGTGGET